MVTPGWVRPEDEVIHFGFYFETPIVGKGISWLPVNQGLVWGVFGWWLMTRNPELGLGQAVFWGFVTMVLFLGSEWGHNFAHAYAAHKMGKPANAIRILFGMPLLAYFSEDEVGVTPREHMLRAAGGPIFNSILIVVGLIWYSFATQGAINGELALVFLSMNIFLVVAGLSPIPFLDGGVILKWGLVQAGKTEARAEKIVRISNAFVGVLLIPISSWLLLNQDWFWGIIFALFSLISFSMAFNLITQNN